MLLGNSSVTEIEDIQLLIYYKSVSWPKRSDAHVTLLVGIQKKSCFDLDKNDENNPIDDVSAIADNMVEVREDTQGSGAAVVEVTHLQVPRLPRPPLLVPHHLGCRQQVEEGHKRKQEIEVFGSVSSEETVFLNKSASVRDCKPLMIQALDNCLCFG